MKSEDLQRFMLNLVQKVQADMRIRVYLNSEVVRSSGYLGNFNTRLKTPEGEVTVPHGAAIVATDGTDQKVLEALRVEVNGERLSREALLRMHPVDSPKEGIFFASLDGYPNTIDEAIVQGRAAAVRASVILAKERIMVSGVAPAVSRADCAACLTCVRVCPCGVPYVGEKGYAEIDPAICRGCGTCMAECPGKAISLQQHSGEEMLARLEMFKCSACRQPYVTLARFEYLKRKLPARDIQLLDRGLCPTCSRRKGAEDQAAWIV
jgi:heterodisulfide reductase subunit A-like polyferredoxin